MIKKSREALKKIYRSGFMYNKAGVILLDLVSVKKTLDFINILNCITEKYIFHKNFK